MKTLGIVAHSAEGGALCFLTACREGQRRLGAHLHPEIVLSAVPMGRSMPAWEAGDRDGVARHLRHGVEQVAAAGADFFVCPDNTAHLVLEPIVDSLPLPGLHIADVVCREMRSAGFRVAGLLGTEWTMNGSVYAEALARHGRGRLVPRRELQERIHAAIFDELCRGVFRDATTDLFVRAINELGDAGADCVILGCTEIPLIVSDANSPLPTLDSTRLLARYAVGEALAGRPLPARGWIPAGDGEAPAAG